MRNRIFNANSIIIAVIAYSLMLFIAYTASGINPMKSFRITSQTEWVHDYLLTVNFEISETYVYWNDEHGDWLRQTFAPRLENVVVQLLIGPERRAGKCLNHTI